MHFKSVIGQEKLKSRLIEEVKNDKVSHAQLFLGKPGYGTLPMALAFAQYLFCENKGEKDSCGECSSCLRVDKMEHPDLHFSFPTVQALSNTSDPFLSDWREQVIEMPYFNLNSWLKRIDPKERKPIISVHESQQIIKKLTLKAFEGGYKVMIIWMAEEMNPQCANKLLKIIEEPPAKTVFILVAESQDYILQTILSRTQKIIFPKIGCDDTIEYLKSKKGGAPSESIVSRSKGDLIEAQELFSENQGEDANNQLFIQLMRVCYKKNVLDMISWAEDITKTSKENQKQFLKYALHMFRQSILRNYTGDVITRVSEDEDAFLENFAKFITGNNIQSMTESFSDSVYYIERNANTKILFTNLCFQVMRHIHTG
ncbi:MAG: DNA polymerase III subunit delta' [Fluviicola sp.]|nr:DNA polymerase III subunit delta' [Fluviicola sp.]